MCAVVSRGAAMVETNDCLSHYTLELMKRYYIRECVQAHFPITKRQTRKNATCHHRAQAILVPSYQQVHQVCYDCILEGWFLIVADR